MRTKHQRLFFLYLGAGLLNIGLLLLMPFLQVESTTWMFIMFPLLTVIWFANAFVQWKQMKKIADEHSKVV
ncbi:hypothetical protein [Exiguobacterium aurantiacum]|uniref:hypothetical protein n=1 Tax=Exiguobacterium aurantiacum TaxID=33987 RepID=UPI00039ADECA|nr:hypothetical protein [Exiguobacterium aurantiacum]